MKDRQQLRQELFRIDGRGYKAYKSLQGSYNFAKFSLHIDRVQGDPFASPSRIRTTVPMSVAGIPAELLHSKVRRIAVADYLSREFFRAIRNHCKQQRGSGKSGLFHIDSGNQEILERTSVLVSSTEVETRFEMGLPAAGRRILGREAAEMFLEELPRVVESSLLYENLSPSRLRNHVETAEDQDAIRRQLLSRKLVAFVADGAVLPRRSGVDDQPLGGPSMTPAVPFDSPPELRVELNRPNGGPITGMGIPEGITLIVGGGYHGKSTLLRAIERGVYNHIPGDGRENVVAIGSAVKIRAEDGRFVAKVDISPFISNLPFSHDTTRFSSENASGSTSQAANIIEALEIGTEVLLVDEDTSATNFIIRDARMQALVEKAKEPITPFIDRVRQLYEEYRASSILVMGGSGDYFDVADNVILMDHYRPHCVTQDARKIVQAFPTRRTREIVGSFGECTGRVPDRCSIDASRGRRDVKVSAKGLRSILFGRQTIDLSCVEQLVDRSQTRAIGEALVYMGRDSATSSLSIRQALSLLEAEMDEHGLDVLAPWRTGDLARPRIQEIGAALNRLRSLRILPDLPTKEPRN